MSDTLEAAKLLVDAYNFKRNERLAVKKHVDTLEKEEHELKAKLIEAIKGAGASAVGGKTAIVKLVTKDEPTAGDWDKFYAHIRNTGEFELLYRRINPASIKERKDLGVDVPGIDWFPIESLSLSQIK